jgi:hypothetical protein
LDPHTKERAKEKIPKKREKIKNNVRKTKKYISEKDTRGTKK